MRKGSSGGASKWACKWTFLSLSPKNLTPAFFTTRFSAAAPTCGDGSTMAVPGGDTCRAAVSSYIPASPNEVCKQGCIVHCMCEVGGHHFSGLSSFGTVRAGACRSAQLVSPIESSVVAKRVISDWVRVRALARHKQSEGAP